MVAKGAILSAIHSDLIGQTYVQLSIGIGWDEDFDEKHHDEKHKTIDVRDGNESVRDCINWLFRLVSISWVFKHYPIVINDLI